MQKKCANYLDQKFSNIKKWEWGERGINHAKSLA